MYLVKINRRFNKLQLTTPSQAPVDSGHSQPGSIGDSSFTEVIQVQTKLPKLQLDKFNGEPKVVYILLLKCREGYRAFSLSP